MISPLLTGFPLCFLICEEQHFENPALRFEIVSLHQSIPPTNFHIFIYLQVSVTEVSSIWQGKSCYAHSDPHMKTFDDMWVFLHCTKRKHMCNIENYIPSFASKSCLNIYRYWECKTNNSNNTLILCMWQKDTLYRQRFQNWLISHTVYKRTKEHEKKTHRQMLMNNSVVRSQIVLTRKRKDNKQWSIP